MKKLFGRWFPKKNLISQGSIEEILNSINSIIGLDQLLETFSAKIKELFNVSSMFIVLYEPITYRYVGRKARGDHAELLNQLAFTPKDKIIKWLAVNREILDVAKSKDVVRYLSPEEQKIIETTNTAFIVPLVVLDRVTGLMLLGPCLHKESLSSTEMNILNKLAAQSALAIEYALTFQFEEDKLRKLFHADKLATIGGLAAGAAHEIRNPLTSIRSSIQYVQKDLSDEKQKLVSEILGEVDRIDLVIRGLLSFSKTSQLQLKTVSVVDIIDQTLLLLETELRNHNIAVKRENSSDVADVNGDITQLKQVFLNILINSIQAMPHGGSIRVAISNDTPVAHPRDNFVAVEILDTAGGIPEATLAKVFDPFFTTKDGGTGLGLSISYGIISRHGGEIEIKNKMNEGKTGTAVTIKLPKAGGGG